MKKYLTTLFLLLLTLMGYAQQAPDGFYYEGYYVFMTVHADNSYDVVEVMRPYFVEPRHGLFRTIPTDMWVKRDTTAAQDRTGSVMRHYKVGIENIEVNSPYQVDYVNSVADVRIGSADKLVEGSQCYRVSYTMSVPDDRIPQADLFFHTLLGTANPCTVQKFGFRIYFDQPLSPEALQRLEAYMGPEGSSANVADSLIFEATPDSISGMAYDLHPYEGVSVYVPLPEGYFAPPRPDDIRYAWCCLVLAGLAWLYVIYREVFRSNRVTKVVTFYPPKGISSADVGTIFDCSADDQDLISLIPWFADQGYLTIEKREKDGHLLLHYKADLPDTAPDYQKTLFEALFSGTHLFDTTQPTNIKFGKAWLKAKKQLDHTHRKAYDDPDLFTFLVLIVALFMTALAVGYADTDPDAAFQGSATFILLGIEAVVMFFLNSTTPRYSIIIFLMVIFGSLFMVAGPIQLLSDDLYLPRQVIQGLLTVAFAGCLFTFRLSEMSDYRRKHMGEILGLREFIETADKDRLQMLLTADGRYFYHVLPFAVAFGMADRWAKQFRELTNIESENFTGSFDASDFHRLSRLHEASNMIHGIKSEQDRLARERAAAARSRASSGSSYHSSSSWSSGGGGYSGGGSGGGGSRSW